MSSPSILITGCSSGIGLAAATVLKQRGYHVFAAARKEDDVAQLKTQGLDAILLDVNNQASMTHALDYILQQTGGTLDALFNNAGMLQAGAVEDLSREMVRAQFETNVFGPMELIKLVLPIMRKQGHGRIIQNSSILGVITFPYYGAYNASKFALEGFSLTLRQELRGTNIHVSIINPGPIHSKLRANAHDRYHQTLKQQANVHEEAYQHLEATYFKPSKQDQTIMNPPALVVEALIHALESKRPRMHYFIGKPAKALAVLKRLLPEGLLETILSTMKSKPAKDN